MTTETPWGWWKVLHNGSEGVVKMLTVNPGCMLSLQAHKHRTEYWVPLSDGLVAYRGAKEDPWEKPEEFTFHTTQLKAHQTYAVSKGVIHRLINPGAVPVSVVEIINGLYDESDIVRYHDAYGRN